MSVSGPNYKKKYEYFVRGRVEILELLTVLAFSFVPKFNFSSARRDNRDFRWDTLFELVNSTVFLSTVFT